MNNAHKICDGSLNYFHDHYLWLKSYNAMFFLLLDLYLRNQRVEKQNVGIELVTGFLRRVPMDQLNIMTYLGLVSTIVFASAEPWHV
jgi:hypothetical protein